LSFGITFLHPNLENTHAQSFCGRLHGGDLLAKGTTGTYPASTVYKFTYSIAHQVDEPQQDFEISGIAREHISIWHWDMHPNNLCSFNNPLCKVSNKNNFKKSGSEKNSECAVFCELNACRMTK
jgi:hypothetical protein